MSFFTALIENPLILYAFFAGLLASIVGGIIGSYVVVKRITFICGSIAHAVLGGIGVSLWLERTQEITLISPLYGALIASILSAILLSWVRQYYHQREDTVIAIIWSVGMSIGIVFISLTPGFNVELTNYLIGNILWVAPRELYLLAGLDLIVLAIVACYHKKFVAICYDEDQAKLQGLSVNALYLLLLMLTAISVVLLVQVVGIVLVLAMLTIPPAMANLWTIRMSHMMAFAVILTALFCTSGLAISYHLDWPSGACIALITALAYAFALLFTKKV
ncbi:MAG: metal ABC transporter permease [Chlamydiales bacterium]